MDDRRLLEQHHRGVTGGAARLVRIRASLALVNKELTSTRASARQAIPDELRRDVRMLGERLGRVIKDYGGASLLKDVETLRRSVIRGREADEHERRAENIVAGWSPERAEQVAHAFTCYFHLVNLAEEHHRARVLRESGGGTGPMPESLAATVPGLRRRLGRGRLMNVLASLEVHPVFTAHPTEARRRAVVAAIRRVGDQLDRVDDPRMSETERRESMRRLTEEIDSLWRTGQLRTSQVTPLDEVRSTMAVFDETLFRVVPEIYRALDWALGPADSGLRPPLAPPFLRFGSWVGGDRDGNGAVTAKVTYEAVAIQAEHALLALEAATTRIGRSLAGADVWLSPGRARGAPAQPGSRGGPGGSAHAKQAVTPNQRGARHARDDRAGSRAIRARCVPALRRELHPQRR